MEWKISLALVKTKSWIQESPPPHHKAHKIWHLHRQRLMSKAHIQFVCSDAVLCWTPDRLTIWKHWSRQTKKHEIRSDYKLSILPTSPREFYYCMLLASGKHCHWVLSSTNMKVRQWRSQSAPSVTFYCFPPIWLGQTQPVSQLKHPRLKPSHFSHHQQPQSSQNNGPILLLIWLKWIN